MVRRVVAVAVGLVSGSLCVGAADIDQSPAIERALDATYLTIARVKLTEPDPPRVMDRVWQAGQAFEAALASAATAMTGEEREAALANETRSIGAKLTAIAEDRRERPGVYETVLDYYRQPRPWKSGLAPQAPEMLETETYRLAWEFCLLTPSALDFKSQAAEAIGRIGNPASAITLLHSYRVNSQPGIRPDRVEEARRKAVYALAQLPSSSAARAILQVLAQLEEQAVPMSASERDLEPSFVSMALSLSGNVQEAWVAAFSQLETAGEHGAMREEHEIVERVCRELRRGPETRDP